MNSDQSSGYMLFSSTHMPPIGYTPPPYAPETQAYGISNTQTPLVPEKHEVGSSSQMIGVHDGTDNRMWIRPINHSFKPIKVGRTITNIIKSKFENPATVWNETTRQQRDYLFGEFKKKYKWDPLYDKEVKKVWETKNKVALRQAMHKVRCGRDKGKWIPEYVRVELERKWAEPTYVMRSEQEKQKRASQIGRFVHISGSIPVAEHKEWLWEKYGREPTHAELFLTTHQKKGTEEFVNARSISLYEKFTRMKETRSSHASISASGVGALPDDNAIYLETVRGMSANSCVYGIGSKARHLRNTSGTSGPFGSWIDSVVESSIQGAIAKVMDQVTSQYQEYQSTVASLRQELEDVRRVLQSQHRA